MSITALVWISLYCLAAVGSFANPLFGALGYLLEYYMRPELKWWGHDLPALRWNLIISMVLGLTFLIRRNSLPKMAEVPNRPLKWLIALNAVMVLVTLTTAVNRTVSTDWMIQWTKLAIIFPLLVVGVVRTRRAFDAFALAHMLGAFWWGWDAWNDPKREASRLVNVGSGDTQDDNSASAHLLTVLPFIVIYLLTAKEKWMRIIALLALPFVVNTLILCNSRGAFVGLLAGLAMSFVRVRSGKRMRLAAAGVGFLAVVYFLADAQFIARQQTTTNYEEDGSAQQRILTWKGAWRLVQDRPFGAGGRGFHLLSPVYAAEVVEQHRGDLRAPHNTWAMVACEWGVLGLICYIGFYGATFRILSRIRKRAGPADDPNYYYWRAFAIEVGLVAYLCASTFSDRLYAEAGYWMIGLTYALCRLQATAEAEEAVVEPAAVTAPAVIPWSMAASQR
jgi:putative inorganic carbon (HCO3(-)) transporter